MTVLSVKELGKSYISYPSEWHRFARWFGVPVKIKTQHWILRHISFAIGRGESVGIVGKNGEGKSTLLKMIVGTLQPTAGEIHLNGSIAAILELGMGFNDDLTGRQNACHAMASMGFSHAKITDSIPYIETFAEIDAYFDEPVRTYSSGMRMRVAFAVATVQMPDILIVDEALAVGDAYFQHKCFERMRNLREQGTILLLVSHDKNAILNLCDRAILLDQGRIIKDTKPEEVFDFYNAMLAVTDKSEIKVEKNSASKVTTSSGSGEVQISDIALHNSKGEIATCINVGEKISLKIKVKAYADVEKLVLGFSIKDRLGQIIYGTNTYHTQQVLTNVNKDSEYQCSICFNANLGVGSYSVCVAFTDSDSHLTKNYAWHDLALLFDVVNTQEQNFIGLVFLQPLIKLKYATDDK